MLTLRATGRRDRGLRSTTSTDEPRTWDVTRVPFVLALLAITVPARADIPPGPPPGPAPSPPPGTCDVQHMQGPRSQCVECPASYEQPDKCQRELSGQGYTQACRASGASVWHEVWCRGPASGPPEENKRGCGACHVGASDTSSAALISALGALGLALARRKRRRG